MCYSCRRKLAKHSTPITKCVTNTVDSLRSTSILSLNMLGTPSKNCQASNQQLHHENVRANRPPHAGLSKLMITNALLIRFFSVGITSSFSCRCLHPRDRSSDIRMTSCPLRQTNHDDLPLKVPMGIQCSARIGPKLQALRCERQE